MKATAGEIVAAKNRKTDRVCPKCAKDQPLYRIKLKKGQQAKVNGVWMAVNVDTEIFECVRCRTQFLR